jgi:hypothetical protein
MKTLALATLLSLAACSGGLPSDASKWTCESLIGPVIAMSQERTPRVLSIRNPSESLRVDGRQLECRAQAEWTEGSGYIGYGAEISGDGEITLNYRRF